MQTTTQNPSLARQLYSMTWPMLFGVLSLMTFQLADSAFVGQLGRDPLAALGFTLPMQQLIIGLQVGLGIATTAIVSRTLGAGDELRAFRLGGLIITVGGSLVFVICVALWFLQSHIMTALGAEDSLLPLVRQYWVPWLMAAWTGAFLYFGYSVCRSHGDTKLPGYMMVATSLTNIALDPLYIFVFGWGLPGAAWATVTSFGIGCLVIYPKLLKRHWVRFDLRELALWKALKQLNGIMAPAMVSQLMPAVSAMLATALVAGFGSAAVAAWGLGTRLEFFSIVVVLALTMSMPPMIGRMLGAGDIEQIRKLVRLAVRFVVVWQLAIGLTGVAIGQVLLLGISESSTWVRLLPGLLVAGVSSGVLNAALGREAVSSVPAGRAAMGSGANNTARYVGSALGVTVVAVLAVPVGTPTAAGLVEGWNSAVLFTAAASVVGALVVVVCSTRMVTPPAATPPGR